MANTVISIENVSWAYAGSKTWALKDISAAIGEGEFIAVMGENGSGKTSFCRLINGLIPHSAKGKFAGKIIVDGINTLTSSVAELSQKAGMVFEDPETQMFTARVCDEAAFGLENMMKSAAAIKQKISWALKITGLKDYADYPPGALSGGQKQRLAIACALAMSNRILVMDEPTSQLDPAGAEEALSLIGDLCKNEKLTVIMATGSCEETAEFADKIALLKNGSLAAFDSPQRIFSDGKLTETCGIPGTQVSEFARAMNAMGKPLPFFPVVEDEAAQAINRWLRERERHAK
jgi:energy-coupling factor transporter ATP-binding protein EcfA2